jgi:hypothetical protein
VSISESLSDGRNYIISQYAKSVNKSSSEISDEEKKMLVSRDEEFGEIAQRLEKEKIMGYMVPFLKFVKEQGAVLDIPGDPQNPDIIDEIINGLKTFKNNLNELPMKPFDYAKVDPSKEERDDEGNIDERPGYLRLRDDLARLGMKRNLKKFYDQLTPRMKEYFNKKATEQEKVNLENAADRLVNAKPNKDFPRGPLDHFLFPSKGAVNEYGRPTGKMGTYDDTRSYPDFADPKVAFNQIIDDINDFLLIFELSQDEYLKKILNYGDEAGVLVYKKPYLAISARSPAPLKDLFAAHPHCFSNESQYWNYNSGNIQLIVWNFEKSPADLEYFVAGSVRPDFTLKEFKNSINQNPDGKNFANKSLKEALQFVGIPDGFIDNLYKKLKEEEFPIRAIQEKFIRNQYKSVKELLVAVSRANQEYKISDKLWNELSGIISRNIEEAKGGFSHRELMDTFGGSETSQGTGIYSLSLLSIFDALVGDKYSREEMERIVDNTKKIWAQSEAIMSDAQKETFLAMGGAALESRLLKCLSDRPELERILNDKLNKAK